MKHTSNVKQELQEYPRLESGEHYQSSFDPLGDVYNAPFARQVSIRCLLDEFSISLAMRLLCRMTRGHFPLYLSRSSVTTASSCSILSMTNGTWISTNYFSGDSMSEYSVGWCTDLNQAETALSKILLIKCNICTIDYSFVFFMCFQPLLQKSKIQLVKGKTMFWTL